MATAGTTEFHCQACGRRFRWTPALAGRQAKCSCGNVFRCPDNPSQLDDDIDLVPESPRPAAVRPPVARTQSPAARLEPPEPAPDPTITLYAPLWLLAGGIVIEVTAAFWHDPHDLIGAATHLLVSLVLYTAVQLVAVSIAAKLRGINLGSVGTAALRLAAITVAPVAMVQLFAPLLGILPFGGLIGLAAQFLLYFALLGALFEMEESDTWYCLCVIFLVSLGFYFAMMATPLHSGA